MISNKDSLKDAIKEALKNPYEKNMKKVQEQIMIALGKHPTTEKKGEVDDFVREVISSTKAHLKEIHATCNFCEQGRVKILDILTEAVNRPNSNGDEGR